MFFIPAKVFWLVAAPTNLLTMLALLGVALLFTRLARIGRTMVTLAVLGLFVFAATPLPRVMIRALEDRFAIASEEGRRIDGIVVLGGAVGFTRGKIKFTDEASRMTTAIALARRHPEARLVFAGGAANLVSDAVFTEADAARALFRSVGIPDERVVYENRSRNTRENAINTRAVVTPKAGERWLLVTSAYHMPRAVGSFRAVGFSVEPHPVDFHSSGRASDYIRPYGKWSDGLRVADLAVKEWLGLLAYRLAGYTNELLPGVRP